MLTVSQEDWLVALVLDARDARLSSWEQSFLGDNEQRWCEDHTVYFISPKMYGVLLRIEDKIWPRDRYVAGYE